MTEADTRPDSWARSIEGSATVPEMLRARVALTPEALAYKFHVGGGWRSVTWRELVARSDDVAAGLIGLGVEPGSRVAVIAETRHEWGLCDLAIVGIGGVTVGLYQTSTPEQWAHILADAGAVALFVDHAERLEGVRLVRDRLPSLRHVVVWDAPGGLDEEAGELSLFTLTQQGRAASADQRAQIEARSRALAPTDAVNLVYTSGTTGPPKGAIITHRNVMAMLNQPRRVPLYPDDITLSFLPMCHVAEKIVSFYGRIHAGVATAYARSLDFQLFLEDLAEIRPTIFGSVPRIFEKVYARAQARAEARGRVGAALWAWADGVSRRVSRARRGIDPVGNRIDPVGNRTDPVGNKTDPVGNRTGPGGNKTGPGGNGTDPGGVGRRLELQRRLADKLVYSKLRAIFGGRVRFFLSGAAPISVELLEFFHGAGMLVLEAYGMTESTAISTSNHPEDFKFGTVGRPIEGVELRLAEDGEILVRGATVFAGYHGQSEATAEAVDAEGGLHTGDIGEIDAEGFVKIVDRKKNIIITAGGKNVAPQNIEGLVREDPFISNCVVIGDERPYLVALVTLDEDESPQLAERLQIPYRGVPLMAEDPKVRAHVQAAVDRANAQLGKVEQVRNFAVLPQDLSIEAGELTPTLKTRRKNVSAIHAEIIDRMYNP